MTNTKISTEMYTAFVEKALETDGYKVVDTMNKMALEIKAITVDQYRLASRLIVEAYKKENW